MNNKYRVLDPVNLLFLIVAFPAVTFGQQWCRYDDPAYYRNEAKKLIELEDDDFSKIKCPVLENPQTLPEELVLPMPCGRKMVFRRVSINADHVLDSETIYLGNVMESSDDPAILWQGLQNGPNEKHLAGGYTLSGNIRSLKKTTDLNKLSLTAYYMGKYEVTAHQYQLFSKNLLTNKAENQDAGSSVCKDYNSAVLETSENQVYPATGVSWFDTIAFTRAYNHWLIAGDQQRIKAKKQPVLPWEQGSTGYVRLPTESEWEFAARGGIAGKSDQSVKSYQVNDLAKKEVRVADIREVAIMSQPGDDENALSAVGSLLPNLLGIYDTIGNVDEIVYDLFQLMPTEKTMQGRFGGYLIKGGNINTYENKLSVAYRQEVPFFSSYGEIKSPVTGFRLAISVPVDVGGQKASNQYKEGYANMAQINAMVKAKQKMVSPDKLGNDRKSMVKELNELKKLSEQGKINQQTLKNQLNNLQTSLERSNAELNKRARQVLRESAKSAILTAFSVNEQGIMIYRALHTLSSQTEKMDAAKKMGHITEKEYQDLVKSKQKSFNKIKDKIRQKNKNLNNNLAFYFQTVSHLSENSIAEVNKAIDYINNEFIKLGADFYGEYTKTLLTHVNALKGNRGSLSKSLKEKWTFDLDKFRKKRNEKFNNIL